MSLIDLVDSDAKILEIAQYLDSLSPDERLAQCQSLSGGNQKQLSRKAADSPPLNFEFFVPAGTPPLTQVIHHGKNSQPAFRNFQKRWCKPADREGELYGYNETAVRRLIGPGYFVAHETENEGRDPRGAIVVDYFMTPPEGGKAPGWPAIKPNSSGLQRFVYDKMYDYMRRVSAHVSIGEAHRAEKVMGWFILCRED